MRLSHAFPLLFLFLLAAMMFSTPPITHVHGASAAPESSTLNASYVSITSSLPGQPQFLTVPDNVSGALLYPDLSIEIISMQPAHYTTYVNGKEATSGNVSGEKNVKYIIPNGTTKASISVQVGGKVWSYPNELISSLPISKYYGPHRQVPQYTLYEIEMATLKGFIAAIFALAIAMFTGRKYILEKEKREVLFI